MTADDRSVLHTPRDWIRWGASAFQRAGLHFGHGTDNALDEAFHLVRHALHLPAEVPAIYLEARLTGSECAAVAALLDRRMQTRKPAAYLLGEIDWCGLSFHVDERVLIPRSPLAELIERGFSPWLPALPNRVLDLCTGSGCIGIAIAHHLGVEVDLGEIDPGAVTVCQRNIERHQLGDRVRVVQGDLFAQLPGRYDLIVCNPPYVPLAEWQALPAEFQHEPRRALEAGEDGMDLVERLLVEAPAHLEVDGSLIVEIGGSRAEFEARYADLPVSWPEFERGGDGVFVISRRDLAGWLKRRGG
ncbi:MAG TPA: 50S ribosomal protein L3 N(5)-glutamine methyltransferase [Nevskiaceae bacterium]|nr:50S ribosomal protein L3 N(5)-glutamine methyltransferase [Nevskiaceae bacterium]